MLERIKPITALVNEMFDQLPQSAFESSTTTFLDPAMGGGQFVREIERRLRAAGHSDENIRSRVFGFENTRALIDMAINMHKLVGTYRKMSYDEFFKWDGDGMKFDYVVGNPPYQEGTGNNQTLWDKFVIKSISLLTDSGYLGMIHPAGWRNLSGNFDHVKKALNNLSITYLSIYNIKHGLDIFKAATRFDMYVAKKTKSTSFMTQVKDELGNIHLLDVNAMPFIPNFNFDKFEHLIAKPGEETVELIGSRSMYGIDKKNMSSKKSKKFCFPCVKYIPKDDNDQIDIIFSCENKGMIGTPKVMFGIGSQVGGIRVDQNGEFGLCQFTFGIKDDPKVLELIKKAMRSNEFVNLMNSVQFTTQAYNYKIISTFKKDFWKRFVEANVK